ncbi:YkgJ family cysteine cluster protein [Candidatus Bathyarchaeota archaeon]|nr:YkgJ family cysteine cluster protein [Candidatus Bathyarchaeota archaeon]
MEPRLIQRTFQIPTYTSTYSARYIAPVWAQGFDCRAGDCGLCCLTEKPSGISGVHNVQLDKAICRLYNVKTRTCRGYTSRPDLCKLYPFFFGVEDGQVIISASLECPGTCSDKSARVDLISELLKEPYFVRRTAFLYDCYEKAILNSDLLDAMRIKEHLVPKIQTMFRERRHFPFLLETVQLVYNVFAESMDENAPTILPFPISTLIKSTEGLYIATSFQSHYLGSVARKGSKFRIVSFDEKLEKKKNVNKAIPPAFEELELDKDAQQLLYDYILLLMERPYLSLCAIMAILQHEPASLNYVRSIAGAFSPIEVGATLIAQRDNVKTVDRDTMREIISFSEGNVRGSFIRPDKPHRY